MPFTGLGSRHILMFVVGANLHDLSAERWRSSRQQSQSQGERVQPVQDHISKSLQLLMTSQLIDSKNLFLKELTSTLLGQKKGTDVQPAVWISTG